MERRCDYDTGRKIRLRKNVFYNCRNIIFRQLLGALGKHFKGLPDEPSDIEVEIHLRACRDYYEMFGTVEGKNSPWVGKGDLACEPPEES